MWGCKIKFEQSLSGASSSIPPSFCSPSLSFSDLRVDHRIDGALRWPTDGAAGDPEAGRPLRQSVEPRVEPGLHRAAHAGLLWRRQDRQDLAARDFWILGLQGLISLFAAVGFLKGQILVILIRSKPNFFTRLGKVVVYKPLRCAVGVGLCDRISEIIVHERRVTLILFCHTLSRCISLYNLYLCLSLSMLWIL